MQTVKVRPIQFHSTQAVRLGDSIADTVSQVAVFSHPFETGLESTSRPLAGEQPGGTSARPDELDVQHPRCS